jgi:uncharacterized membrane protein YhiD involved in acid resistance
MFNDLQEITVLALDPAQVLANLVIAFLCGATISYFYRWSHKGATYQVSFVRSLIVLAMITAIVMMVIGNNLARAFGLVGAMSIIRFRTALKDAQDIVFVFFALSIGLAVGVGYRMLAIVSTLFVGIVMLTLTRTNFGALQRRGYVLQFLFNPTESKIDEPYMAVIKRYCRRHKLLNMKSRAGGSRIDLVFEIDLRKSADSVALTRELDQIDGVDAVSIFTDEDPDV